jgi:protein-L-isoaspartate O-methyltransferase
MTDRPPEFFEGAGMPDPGWWEALWPDPAGVLAAVGMRAGMTVIDLCSGDGWFTAQIAKVAARVIAVDIDPELLEVSRQRLRELGVTNCEMIVGDAYQLPAMVREPVDFVFLANVFHGVPVRPKLVAAARGALKPNGLLAIVNWHSRPREETCVLGEPRGPRTELRMSADATVRDGEAGRLSLVRIAELPPYHYGVVLERREAAWF